MLDLGTSVDITKEQEEFLDVIMDRFNIEYPPRFLTGVKKYKTNLHKDYSVMELIRNAREEIYDNFAYLEALEYQYVEELKKYREKIEELEAAIAKLDAPR